MEGFLLPFLHFSLYIIILEGFLLPFALFFPFPSLFFIFNFIFSLHPYIFPVRNQPPPPSNDIIMHNIYPCLYILHLHKCPNPHDTLQIDPEKYSCRKHIFLELMSIFQEKALRMSLDNNFVTELTSLVVVRANSTQRFGNSLTPKEIYPTSGRTNNKNAQMTDIIRKTSLTFGYANCANLLMCNFASLFLVYYLQNQIH